VTRARFAAPSGVVAATCAVAALAGAQKAALPARSADDIHPIIATIRAARAQGQTDGTLRLLVNGPGSHRFVAKLRVRARAFGPLFKTLIEVQDTPSLEGRLLLVHDGTLLETTSWHHSAATPAAIGVTAGPADDTGIGWLSPCLLPDDLVELHFWWPHQTLERTEMVSGRSLHVVSSRAGPDNTGAYAQVTTWVDTERMAPVRAEKAGRREGATAQVSYDQWRHRDGRWMPGRVTIVRPDAGCRVVLTGLRGTTRAKLPASLFDAGRLAPASK
jgi:hypothetical protein